MEKVIITGASGFVGKNLTKYLEGYYEVIGVGRNSTTNYNNYQVHPYDIIVHLAGKAHDLKNVSKPDEYYQVNYELTKKIYDNFLESGASTFIYMSSVKAVADEVDGILTEESTPNPQTHYGKSKLLAEQYILENQRKDKRIFILRPCMIHGEGNKGNLNLLYNIVKKGIPYPLGAFENKRSFLTVSNLCYVIKEIISNTEIENGIFNVADDEPISTTQLIAIIGEVLNKKVEIWKIPVRYIKLLSRIGDKLKLPLNTERLGKLTSDYVVTNSKIKLAIGKEFPLKTKIGLLETLRTFRR